MATEMENEIVVTAYSGNDYNSFGGGGYSFGFDGFDAFDAWSGFSLNFDLTFATEEPEIVVTASFLPPAIENAVTEVVSDAGRWWGITSNLTELYMASHERQLSEYGVAPAQLLDDSLLASLVVQAAIADLAFIEAASAATRIISLDYIYPP